MLGEIAPGNKVCKPLFGIERKSARARREEPLRSSPARWRVASVSRLAEAPTLVIGPTGYFRVES